MSDDVSALFKKKSGKKKDKVKKHVVNLDEVFAELKKSNRKLEDEILENEEELEDEYIQVIQQEEDLSEIIPQGLSITNYDEATIIEHTEPEEKKEDVPVTTKGWGTVNQTSVDTPTVINTQSSSSAYVPPASRNSRVRIDINSVASFPSITDAQEIEKEIEEHKSHSSSMTNTVKGKGVAINFAELLPKVENNLAQIYGSSRMDKIGSRSNYEKRYDDGPGRGYRDDRGGGRRDDRPEKKLLPCDTDTNWKSDKVGPVNSVRQVPVDNTPDNWRRGPAPTSAPEEPKNNSEIERRPPPPSSSTGTLPPAKNRYVPPHMRN
ncbi:Glycoside hydrolase, family 11/12-containing protein [Strongyloides ratti]|uniref:Glycoside hydrolase, family 11/12-containing protein n=1 Tax=Strongyloides ratti TaxID=34506 RepID=A0A090LHU8_STRRB|nr:Glycoside hydrolase, family 11/12-containing protein [Strongyloides ratti]CEF67693.1 Glycoside hydrolase, family 11/12-containing protein [Strongyloides ratti]